MTRTIQQLRTDARLIFDAGIASVDPVAAVQKTVTRQGDFLSVAGEVYDLRQYAHVYVIGAGKAGATMAQGLENVLQDRLTAGAVTVKYDHVAPVTTVTLHEAGHPIPDAAGVRGAEAMMHLAQQAGENDLVFCLLSGGGSALSPAPSAGITLEEKQQFTSLLLACGASIDEINTLRKHLSRLKGGQLARLVAPARLITLVLSDVVGDRLDVIASGPTVPDASTFTDCREIVARYRLMDQLPPSIRSHLQRGCAGQLPETPKAGEPMFDRCQTVLIGSNRIALQAAAQQARDLGYPPLVLSSSIQGEAREIARVHAAMAHEIRQSGLPMSPPVCVLAGGETTVTLLGQGKGGRNQEFALAAAMDIDGLEGVVILSGGTDGTDGPTDAAGAVADGATARRAQALGLNPEEVIQRSDSYSFFNALDDLLFTGPTGTNVMDIYILLVG
ncbi:glycerate kinase type-2 family protein [Candidatus Entotheonella palauensis]|uniref:glycerate kinase type-2 family protein n=1 Tax=Candidatus Entotheonella palauensis TaxID=93172 RepID=UPI000B802869|nr:glycerate kinase [Candidatus Entotheonella palauensis]